MRADFASSSRGGKSVERGCRYHKIGTCQRGSWGGRAVSVHLSLPLGLGTVWEEERRSRMAKWAARKQNGGRWKESSSQWPTDVSSSLLILDWNPLSSQAGRQRWIYQMWFLSEPTARGGRSSHRGTPVLVIGSDTSGRKGSYSKNDLFSTVLSWDWFW